MRRYLPLIRKDSITHIHVLAVYVTEGLLFARDLSLENSVNSYLCLQIALIHPPVLLPFPLSITLFVVMRGF